MNRPLLSATLQRFCLFCAAPVCCAVGIFCAVFAFGTAPTLHAVAAGSGESPATVGATAEPPSSHFYKTPASSHITVNGKVFAGDKASASSQVFVYQENLHGVIKDLGETPDQINIFFSGTFSLSVSGNQLGSHNPDAQAVWLKIPVSDLLIVVQKERSGGSPFWAQSTADWQQTLLQLQELAQSKAPTSFRLRLPTPIFAENGDLLLLKCSGIAPIVKLPYNSHPQPDAVDR